MHGVVSFLLLYRSPYAPCAGGLALELKTKEVFPHCLLPRYRVGCNECWAAAQRPGLQAPETGQAVLAAFTIVFGGLVLALAPAFGLGGKDIARSFLEDKFKKEKTD